MRKEVLILFLFISFLSFSQNKEIITYYNSKGQITKEALKAVIIQKVSKESDSLWLFRRFRRNNQLAVYWYSKTKDSQNKIGQMVTFDLNDSISSIKYFNNQGLENGKFSSWFDNRNKNSEGRYVNGKKEGLWRRYYYTGELSAKAMFKNDSLINERFYTKDGAVKEKDKNCCRKNPEFKGGIKKYRKMVQKFLKTLDYKIKGSIIVNYTIGIDGKLTNVRIYDFLPLDLKNKIIDFFNNIDGWQPGFLGGREMPFQNSFTIHFK